MFLMEEIEKLLTDGGMILKDKNALQYYRKNARGKNNKSSGIHRPKLNYASLKAGQHRLSKTLTINRSRLQNS